MQPMDWNGHKQLLSAVYYAAFPDLHADIEDMTAGGRMVSVHIRYTGHTRESFKAYRRLARKYLSRVF